jgi:DNA-binding transcriptional ArsR family regulator
MNKGRSIMTEVEKLAGIFKLFSVGARIRIVQALKNGGLCVTELASHLGISQEATSQHLRVLRDAKIVWFQKRGLHVYYSLDKKTVAFIQKAVSELYKLGGR